MSDLRVLINNGYEAKLSYDLLQRSLMFKDLVFECECDTDIIPITFPYPVVAKRYIENDYENIIDPNELVKYLQFAQFIRDENGINKISNRIVKNIVHFKDDVIDDLIPEIENPILQHIPKVSALEYLYYNYGTVRDNINWNILLHYNQTISLDFVERNMNKFHEDWRSSIGSNSILTPTFVEKYMYDYSRSSWGLSSWYYLIPGMRNELDWNWKKYFNISANSSVATPEFVEKHIDKPWYWGDWGLSYNKSMTTKFVEKYINKPWEWGRDGLSLNLNVTIEFMEKYKNKPWNWGCRGLSSNPHLTSKFIEKYINAKWDWKFLSYNENITPKLLEKHMDKPWDWDKLSYNKNITLEFVRKHSNKRWNMSVIGNRETSPTGLSNFFELVGRSAIRKIIERWECDLSGHRDLKLEDIKDYIDKPWDWGEDGLSRNPTITVEFVEEHMDKPWCWNKLNILPKRFNSIREYKSYITLIRMII